MRAHAPEKGLGLCLSRTSIKICSGDGPAVCYTAASSAASSRPSAGLMSSLRALRGAALIPRRCNRTESRANVSVDARATNLGHRARASREDERGAGQPSQLKIRPEHSDETLL